jgi:hypothetical protein
VVPKLSSIEGRTVMAAKDRKDKEKIGEIGERGLFLVSDRTPSWEWESLPRREPKRALERLGPLKPGAHTWMPSKGDDAIDRGKR